MPTRSADLDFRGAHTFKYSINVVTYQRRVDFPLPRRGGNFDLYVDINNYCPTAVDHWLSPAVTPLPAGLTFYSTVLSCVRCSIPHPTAVVCVEYMQTMSSGNRCIAVNRHYYEAPGKRVKRRRLSSPSIDVELFVKVEEFTPMPVHLNEKGEVVVPGQCSNAYLIGEDTATYRFPHITSLGDFTYESTEGRMVFGV